MVIKRMSQILELSGVFIYNPVWFELAFQVQSGQQHSLVVIKHKNV